MNHTSFITHYHASSNFFILVKHLGYIINFNFNNIQVVKTNFGNSSHCHFLKNVFNKNIFIKSVKYTIELTTLGDDVFCSSIV
jgi:hypothetical protein